MRTNAEVCFEYWYQLNEELDRIQDEWDWEEAQALLDHPEIATSSWYQPGMLDFMCELFNAGRLEFHYNQVRFYHPPGFVLDERLLGLLSTPDVCWTRPGVHVEGGELVVELLLIDA